MILLDGQLLKSLSDVFQNLKLHLVDKRGGICTMQWYLQVLGHQYHSGVVLGSLQRESRSEYCSSQPSRILSDVKSQKLTERLCRNIVDQV
jgi:hypothetical protein